jgi:hypothetical protein
MTEFPSKGRWLSAAGLPGPTGHPGEMRGGPFCPSSTTVISRTSTGSRHGHE